MISLSVLKFSLLPSSETGSIYISSLTVTLKIGVLVATVLKSLGIAR